MGWEPKVVGDNPHDLRVDHCSGPILTIVRKREPWLKSVYARMKADGWRPFPGPACILGKFKGGSFNEFLRDMNGWDLHGHIMRMYTKHARYILRTEHLARDLSEVLIDLGHQHSYDELVKVPVQDPSSWLPEWPLD